MTIARLGEVRSDILTEQRDVGSVNAVRYGQRPAGVVDRGLDRLFLVRGLTVDGFSQWMRDAITAAGLPLECQPHGLRKAAGRRLAEAGCTAHEIMAVLGHKTLAEAERYTREADQARLAEGAVAKLEGRKANKLSQTTSNSWGKLKKRTQDQIDRKTPGAP
jgi:integrase